LELPVSGIKDVLGLRSDTHYTTIELCEVQSLEHGTVNLGSTSLNLCQPLSTTKISETLSQYVDAVARREVHVESLLCVKADV
jgi:hypothetical protein